MTDPAPPPEDEPRAEPSLVPFAAALALIVVVGVLAALFLRGDDTGELVRPDRIAATGDDAVQAQVFELPECQRVVRAQVDFEDARILLELVAEEVDGCEADGVVDVVADVTLPQPIGDRELVPGVGRTRLPCTPAGDTADVACAPAR